jgi:Protein of unknown function (DUF992)
MRWVLAIALPVSLAGSPDPGAMLPFEVGVLSCTLGHAIDPEMSTQTGAASDAREMLCTFSRARDGAEETYVGSLKSIRGARGLPDNIALLWTVRAPIGTWASPGLLQQSYAADAATPQGQMAPLVGESNGGIALHIMTDQEAGSVSNKKQAAPQFIITAIELKLKIAAT